VERLQNACVERLHGAPARAFGAASVARYLVPGCGLAG